MEPFGSSFLGQVRLLGQRYGWPPAPPTEVTVFTPRQKPKPRPSDRMTPEQKAGIPEEMVDDIDLLCGQADILARYLDDSKSMPYAEYEKATKIVNDTLNAYGDQEGFLKQAILPWCPEAVDYLQGVVNESRQKYVKENPPIGSVASKPYPFVPVEDFPPMPTPPTSPPPPTGTPISSPTTPMRPSNIPVGATSSIPTLPMTPTPTGGAPQYSTDLQRQIDSYNSKAAEFASKPRPYTDVYSRAPVPTPTAPCPPGQFPAYPGGPCRQGVATGGLPGLPGLAPADVATGVASTPGVVAPGMGRSFRVMNLG